jgi:hypothetical protein
MNRIQKLIILQIITVKKDQVQKLGITQKDQIISIRKNLFLLLL